MVGYCRNCAGLEQFIIELQAKFIPDEATANILQIVGNITDGTVNTFADDGITQQVTSKSGIGRVVNASVPNPVTLVPHRTFSEIEQPAGKFIFRMRPSESGRPSVGLFQADAGVWENVAAERIRQWFIKELGDVKHVLILA